MCMHLRCFPIPFLTLLLIAFVPAPVVNQLQDEPLCDIREVDHPSSNFGETGTLILSGFTFLDTKTLQMSTELSHVPRGNHYFEFSPDNTLIAFIREEGSPVPTAFRQTIYSLTDDEMVSTFSWKPEWLAFAGWVGSELAFFLQDDHIGLELVDIQGVSQRKFTFDDLSLTIPDPFAPPEGYPPDDMFFIWASVNQSLDLAFFINARDMNPYRPLVFMNAETGEIFYQASEGETSQFWGSGHLRRLDWLTPSWAHRSRQLLINLSDSNLYLIPASSVQDSIQITTERQLPQGATLSSDDRYVAFFSNDDDVTVNKTLHIIDLESGRSIALPGLRTYSFMNWAPDGHYLAFYDLGSVNPSEKPHLIVVDVEDCEIWRGSVLPDASIPFVLGWFKPR